MCFEDERWEIDCRTSEQMVDDILKIIQKAQTKRSLTGREFNNCQLSLLRLKEKVAAN